MKVRREASMRNDVGIFLYVTKGMNFFEHTLFTFFEASIPKLQKSVLEISCSKSIKEIFLCVTFVNNISIYLFNNISITRILFNQNLI